MEGRGRPNRARHSPQRGRRRRGARGGHLPACLAAPSAAAAERELRGSPLLCFPPTPRTPLSLAAAAASPGLRSLPRMPACLPAVLPRCAAIFVATLATERLTHLGAAGPWLLVWGQQPSFPRGDTRRRLCRPPRSWVPARPAQPGLLVPGEDKSRGRAGLGGRGGGGGSCGGSLPPGRDHHLISTGNDMANGREGRSGAEPGDPPNREEEEGSDAGWEARPRQRRRALPPSAAAWP